MLNKIKSFMLFGILTILLYGCGSSVEYTSAKMAIQNENWDEVEEFLLKALVVEPENAEIMVQIGYHIHAKKQEWLQMNKMFDNAVSVNPEGKVLGRPVKEIVKNYRSMYWADSYNKAVIKFNKYKNSKDKSALKEAVEIFSESIFIDPSQTQTYSILSTSHFELGNKEKAISTAKKAYELMPNEFQPNFTLGQILALTGDKENAVSYVEKAVEINPSDTDAIRQLATLYYDTGQKEKSADTFETAIKQETDNVIKANLYFNLGVLYMKLDRLQDAEDNFMSAYDMNPEDTEALVGIAQVFENAEKWRRASRFYRELITLDPDNPDHFKGMARVLIKQGDMNGATRYFEKAKKLGG